MRKNTNICTILESVAVKERGVRGGFRKSLQTRVSAFATKGNTKKSFTAEEAYTHLIGFQDFDIETMVCTDYLTGKPINLLTELWHLDHIDPTAGNIVSNMGITRAVHNMMKSNTPLKMVIEDCEKILRHHKPELFKNNI